MAGRGKGLKAADVAKLPPEQWPDWYKPASGRPARPYRAGNTERLDAGHRSPRVFNSVAAALSTGLMASREDLRHFPEAVAAWADAEARAALLRYDLDQRGMFDDTGEVRESRVRTLERFERRAANERARLGLDPTSEAELALLRARALQVGAHFGGQGEPLDALAQAGRDALEALAAPEDDPQLGIGATGALDPVEIIEDALANASNRLDMATGDDLRGDQMPG